MYQNLSDKIANNKTVKRISFFISPRRFWLVYLYWFAYLNSITAFGCAPFYDLHSDGADDCLDFIVFYMPPLYIAAGITILLNGLLAIKQKHRSYAIAYFLHILCIFVFSFLAYLAVYAYAWRNW